MAGTLYLGRNKVCPAILVGGSPEPEPTEYCTIKLPDSMKVLNGYFNILNFELYDSNDNGIPVVFDFNKCEEISSYAFGDTMSSSDSPIILKADSLKTISIQGFSNCFNDGVIEENHTDINFTNLESIANYAMALSLGLSGITSIHFPKLATIGDGAFPFLAQSVDDVHIYFNSVTTATFNSANKLDRICSGSTNRILHFPSNLSSVIPNQNGYPNFGGTDTVILYDLEATE